MEEKMKYMRIFLLLLLVVTALGLAITSCDDDDDDDDDDATDDDDDDDDSGDDDDDFDNFDASCTVEELCMAGEECGEWTTLDECMAATEPALEACADAEGWVQCSCDCMDNFADCDEMKNCGLDCTLDFCI